MSNLTDPLAALELVKSLLPKSTDTLTQGEENVSSTAQTSVSVHTDTALTPADTPAPGSGGVSAPSVHALTLTNPVQNEKNSSSVSASVQFGDKQLQPARDPDLSGCPTHWHHVPELPPKGSRVRMTDPSGYGSLYRFKACGRWWLVKFLPPFDGMVSLSDSGGRVRVLSSLEEAGALIALLPNYTDSTDTRGEKSSRTPQMSVSAYTDGALTPADTPRLAEQELLAQAWAQVEDLPEDQRGPWRIRLNRERLKAARELLHLEAHRG